MPARYNTQPKTWQFKDLIIEGEGYFEATFGVKEEYTEEYELEC